MKFLIFFICFSSFCLASGGSLLDVKPNHHHSTSLKDVLNYYGFTNEEIASLPDTTLQTTPNELITNSLSFYNNLENHLHNNSFPSEATIALQLISLLNVNASALFQRRQGDYFDLTYHLLRQGNFRAFQILLHHPNFVANHPYYSESGHILSYFDFVFTQNNLSDIHFLQAINTLLAVSDIEAHLQVLNPQVVENILELSESFTAAKKPKLDTRTLNLRKKIMSIEPRLVHSSFAISDYSDMNFFSEKHNYHTRKIPLTSSKPLNFPQTSIFSLDDIKKLILGMIGITGATYFATSYFDKSNECANAKTIKR